MKTCSEYRTAAREALKGNWSAAVIATIIVTVIYAIVTGGDSASTATEGGKGFTLGTGVLILIAVFVLLPLSVGYLCSLKKLHREGDPNVINNTFNIGFHNYGHNVGTMVLMELYTFLWSLLLVIPGLIKSYAYSMTPFILEDEPDLGADATIHRSREMMMGHKMDLFILDLTFSGWIILCIFSLGIGYFWLYPYIYTTHAAFYEDVKAEWEMKQLAAPVQSSDPSSLNG